MDKVELRRAREYLRRKDLRKPLALGRFRVLVHRHADWAHLEFRQDGIVFMQTFAGGPLKDDACWEAALRRFDHLLSADLAISAPSTLLKPSGTPWCASIWRKEFESLNDDEVTTLAFLERALAWAVFFEFGRNSSEPAQ